MSTHPAEIHYFLKSSGARKQAERSGAWPEVIWQSESSPEVFLREVMDTLTRFLRDEPVARAAKTGETVSERQ